MLPFFASTRASDIHTYVSYRTARVVLVIPRYAVTACETGHYILIVFVVMSKEEGSMYRKRLHISVVLGRMDTSQTVLKRSDR